ncbi:uncharacterized protein B0H64DRAFT_444970 [Chaetomium fimeti]|uniref:Uncharacterized protein n=1 Tax=Chaetomium fimeti TaxID=1854472 RepID=A0AAE0HC18_9PEZI|nr:hypothetical protein B0H64DRAFT_444970 [Chaetomium fimeti]
MTREAPETQTEDERKPHGASHHHLGGLPSELFDKILFEIDAVRDLAHFITTARFVYQRFTIQRRAVLFRVLQNELGPVLADARFLFIFPYSDPTDQVRYIEWLYVMTDVYHSMLQGGTEGALPNLEELKGLCRTLYQINFIADIYVTARLTSFDLGGGSGTPATAPPSLLERRRVEDTAAISNLSTHQGEALGLFGTLKPWEMQQIDHVDVFITYLCLALVHNSPQTADGSPEIVPRQFDDLFAHLHLLVQFLQSHRGVADRAVRNLVAAEDLARCEDLYDKYVNAYQMIPLRFAWQADRAVSFPDPVTDKWDQDGLVVPYIEDGLDLTPYGWLDALRGRYVKWFGEGLHSLPRLPTGQAHGQPSEQNDALYHWRHAGFCLWDRKRVEALKELSMFEGQLYTGWTFNRSVERDG